MVKSGSNQNSRTIETNKQTKKQSKDTKEKDDFSLTIAIIT